MDYRKHSRPAWALAPRRDVITGIDEAFEIAYSSVREINAGLND